LEDDSYAIDAGRLRLGATAREDSKGTRDEGLLFITRHLIPPAAAKAQPARVYRIGVISKEARTWELSTGCGRVSQRWFEEGKQFILHVRDGSGDLKVVEQAAGVSNGSTST